eukprot:scaffold91355_cov16-Tisochrysis_lutea.AAC.3
MQKNGGGSIVLTSAAVAESGVPHFEAMSAAKAGVEGRACNVHPSSLYVQASSTLACSRVCEVLPFSSYSCWNSMQSYRRFHHCLGLTVLCGSEQSSLLLLNSLHCVLPLPLPLRHGAQLCSHARAAWSPHKLCCTWTDKVENDNLSQDWLTPSLEFLFYMLEPHSIAVPGCQGQEQISSREHPL